MKKVCGFIIFLVGVGFLLVFSIVLMSMTPEEMRTNGSVLLLIIPAAILIPAGALLVLSSLNPREARQDLSPWQEKKEAIRELQLSEEPDLLQTPEALRELVRQSHMM